MVAIVMRVMVDTSDNSSDIRMRVMVAIEMRVMVDNSNDHHFGSWC